MTVLDPTAKVVLTAYTWQRMQRLLEEILDEAALLSSGIILDNAHKLSSMLDDAMYGGSTSWDDPDQMELDFNEDEEYGRG